MNIKEQIITQLKAQLEEKLELIQQSIVNAKESRDNETKSSVGDKYETGRAMVQMEIEKNQVQFNKTQALLNELSKIDINKKHSQAEFGSCIQTSQGNYFISIGFGRIKVKKEDWFCISISSPIGQQLLHKKVDDILQFQAKEIHILKIQ